MANRIGEKWRNEYETAKEHQVPEIIRKGYAATLEERYEISNEMSAGKTKLKKRTVEVGTKRKCINVNMAWQTMAWTNRQDRANYII